MLDTRTDTNIGLWMIVILDHGPPTIRFTYYTIDMRKYFYAPSVKIKT